MILSFRCPETERIWRGEQSSVFPPEIQGVARRKLRYLNNAATLQDLAQPPGNRLHRFQGDRGGQYSISVNMQWRICFLWTDGQATEVEIVDYH